MNFIKIIACLLANLLLASCSSVAFLPTNDQSEPYPPTNAKMVEVYSTKKVDAEYTVIGQVIASADAGSDAGKSVELLKKQAANLGADAVIELKLEIDLGYWSNAIKASGTAIKYVNQ
jgi:hypothetical protein